MTMYRIFRSTVLLLSLCCLAISFGCSRKSAEDREFEKLSEAFLDDYFEAHPVSATWIGEHAYDGLIDDMGSDARENEFARLIRYLDKLDRLDSEKLSRDNRIDADILRNEIERQIFSLKELESWENNPLVYIRLLGNSIHLLLARDFAPLEDRLDSAMRRIGHFPEVIDQAIGNLRNPPRVHTETAISQNRGVIKLLEEDLSKAAAQVPGRQQDFEKALGPALEALRRFQGYLEKDLYYRSGGDFRLGDELYRRKLALTLMSDMTSEEIVAKAHAEVTRLHMEMFDLAARIYTEIFPNRKLTGESMEERKEIIKEVLAKISNDHPTPDGLLFACREAYDEALAFVRDNGLLPLPAEPLEIIWAPEFSRGVAVAGLRSPGPLDKELKSFYVVSPIPENWDAPRTESFLREYNNEMIRILTIHEAMPGHYVQLAYSNRCPSLIRTVFSSGTFVEGWAEYSERMMLEEGFRNQDPRLWLQRKKFYLRAVINAILDAGIHRGGMTEYEALKLMIEDGFQEESEAKGKWRRACLTSTQLSTYFVGYMEILALREEAEDRWGKNFNVSDFHENLLAHGSPPPRYVRELLFGR